eukprot:Hpha_TRINITY_DN16422_c2_g2::TRINITY_DN16422_c2_g2_i2::g.163645::m.163645
MYDQGQNPYGQPQQPLLDQGQGYPPGPPQGYPPQDQGGYPPAGGGYPPAGPPGGGYGAPPGPPQGYPPQEGGYPPGPPGGAPGYPPPQQDMGQGYPPPQQAGGFFGGAQPPMQTYGNPEDVLASASMLAIKQKVSLMEAAGDLASSVPCAEACCEKENEYEIYDQSHAQMIFYVREHSEMFGLTGRCCCNPAHELRMEIAQAKGQSAVFTIERPFKCFQSCPAWCDACQHEITVRGQGGQSLGGAKQPCCGGMCNPRVDVMESSLESSPFAHVSGPCCCFGGLTEMVCDQAFPVMDPTDTKIGQITKERPEGLAQAVQEIMTDSDLFTLRFDNPQMAPRQKMLLLSTVLLLDYMFFEQNKPWECDPIEQSCSCTCFNIYCCGSYQPCTCKCGGGEGDNSNN